MSQSSSISSTSGFVTPQGSIFSLPLQDEDNALVNRRDSYTESAGRDSRSSKAPIDIETRSVENESDSADTEVEADAKYLQQSSSTSTHEPFLEHLSSSLRPSLDDSDRMEEELAELGIYDSELLGEDSSSDSDSGNNEDWEDLEAAEQEPSGSPGINGNSKGSKKAKWKEAEEELRRGGNRSLAEVRTCSISYLVRAPGEFRYTDLSDVQLVAPIILAHPLALLPIIPLLPHSFLPAGVALFIPIFVASAGLSACSHVVVVYLSR
jgi:hypothetical protein